MARERSSPGIATRARGSCSAPASRGGSRFAAASSRSGSSWTRTSACSRSGGTRRRPGCNLPRLMRTARRSLLSFAVSLALAGPAVAAERSVPAALEPTVERYLRPLVDLDVFQGVVLIARGDRIVLEKGYGFANVELGVRNAPDMVFRVASLTKP